MASPATIEEKESRKKRKKKRKRAMKVEEKEKRKGKEMEKEHRFLKRLFQHGQTLILVDCLIRVDRPWDCEEIRWERPCDLLSDSWDEVFLSALRDPEIPPWRPP